jgi:hypothetical protein
MNEFKVLVDVLSSVASLIAITTVLFSWYRSAQKPLSIQRVVVHNKKDSKRFILVVKNHKNYPITIKGINGFLKSKAQVEKFNGYEPEYKEILSLHDCIFISNEVFEIAANGHTDIKVEDSSHMRTGEEFVFSTHTSHGYHELKCKNITNVEMTGGAKAYGVEFTKEYDSKFKAKLKYLSLKICHSIRNKTSKGI